MILRFGIENFLSFRDRVELSFTSTARRDEPSLRLQAPNTAHGVLPVVGVWGANASGKSNLVAALLALRNAVAESFRGLGPEQAFPWTPWRMHKGADAPPTTMDIDFLVNGIRHHFGFRVASAGIIEEWLYAWPEGRQRVLYHRNHQDKEPWYLGPSLKGQRQEIVSATRPNSLFLSAAAQFNHPQLRDVYRAITSGIVRDTPVELRRHPVFFSDAPILDPQLRNTVLDLLAAADLGVRDMRAIERPDATAKMRTSLSNVFSEDFINEVSSSLDQQGVLMELRLIHGTDDEDAWELKPGLESRGTWILLSRLNDLLDLLKQGQMLLIDEIDTSLHPDLCGALVDLFITADTNPNGAQLLFTTHDRSLLTRLRTDEVVLADRGRDGVSQLRTASDYKALRTREDLRQAHEQGRLRGVPVLGDLTRIIAEELHRGA